MERRFLPESRITTIKRLQVGPDRSLAVNLGILGIKTGLVKVVGVCHVCGVGS
jgi:hypothetical protein